MKFYVNESLNNVLTEKEYLEVVERESKELDIPTEKLIENESDYKFYNVDLEDFEGYLLTLDNLIQAELNTNQSIFDGETRDYIEDGSYSYKLCDNWDLDVRFEVIEDSEKIDDIIVKVIGMELI